MDRGRVGEERGSKETDVYPLTDNHKLQILITTTEDTIVEGVKGTTKNLSPT
jgi:hypothetical protein